MVEGSGGWSLVEQTGAVLPVHVVIEGGRFLVMSLMTGFSLPTQSMPLSFRNCLMTFSSLEVRLPRS